MKQTLKYIIGYELICIIFVAYVISSLLLVFKIPINSWVLPISYLIITGCTYIYQSHYLNQKNIGIFIYPLIIIVSSVVICNTIWDYSYDGMAYHQVGIHSLMNGWNPFYEKCLTNIIWVDHYAKGMETMSAIIAKAFGDIESGKAVNYIFIIALLLIIYDVIDDYLPRHKKFTKTVFSLLITFSPVVVCQFLTYYIDFMSYILIVLITANIYLYEKKESWLSIIMIAICLALAISIKFNIAFWCGLELIIYCIYLVIKKQWNKTQKGIICTISGVFISIFLLSYNPYITNVKEGHHILYPILGEGKVDIMTNSTPDRIKDMDNVSAVIYSLFSRPYNIIKETGTDYSTKTKIKFALYEAGNTDSRLGGFGFLFPEVLIMSLITMIFLFKRKHHQFKYLSIILIGLFLSLLILPSGWWARYVPFFYLFPILIFLYAEKIGLSNKYVTKVLFMLLFTNISITTLSVSRIAYNAQKNIRENINLFNENSSVHLKSENYGFNYKLEKRGINIIPTDSASQRLYVRGPEVFIFESDIK